MQIDDYVSRPPPKSVLLELYLSILHPRSSILYPRTLIPLTGLLQLSGATFILKEFAELLKAELGRPHFAPLFEPRPPPLHDDLCEQAEQSNDRTGYVEQIRFLLTHGNGLNLSKLLGQTQSKITHHHCPREAGQGHRPE